MPYLRTKKQREIFLSKCPNKIKLRQIIAALGLEHNRTGTCISFTPGSPSGQLRKELEAVADNLLNEPDWNTHGNRSESLRRRSFTSDVTPIGTEYGPRLWGREARPRAHLTRPDNSPRSSYRPELYWDHEPDNTMLVTLLKSKPQSLYVRRIRFLLRCWIIKTANHRSRTTTRTTKGPPETVIRRHRERRSSIIYAYSSAETSDTDDIPLVRLRRKSLVTPKNAFRAPTARMLTATTPANASNIHKR